MGKAHFASGTPSKWPNFMAYKWGLLITYKSWNDPRFVVIAPQPGMGVYVPLRLGRA